MLNRIDVQPSIKSDDYQVVNEEHLISRITQSDTVFFTGAGFSKAWCSDYPSGLALFSIDDFESLSNKYNFLQLANELEIDKPRSGSESFEQECYEYFKEIKFHLDTFRRYPSLMPSNLDKTEIFAFEEEMRCFIVERFKDLVGESEFKIDNLEKSNKKMIGLFDEIYKRNNKLSFISTNYDYIIEKIFENVEGAGFTRGVVNKNTFEGKEWRLDRIPLYKINGGFEIKFNGDGFYADYNDDKIAQIILPSQDQIYDNKYFKSVFIKSADKLREAKTLVFIGYSMPVEDHTIRFLLKHFNYNSCDDKHIYVINRDKDSAEKPVQVLSKMFKKISENEGVFVLDGDIDSLSDFVLGK